MKSQQHSPVSPAASESAPTLQLSGKVNRGNAFQQEQLKRTDTEKKTGKLPFGAELAAAFGEDFSDIQVTTGAPATNGEQVSLPSNPDLEQVAHEVAHVVQYRQSSSEKNASKVDHVEDPAEVEAREVAAQVAQGESVEIHQSPSAILQRDGEDETPQARIQRLIADADMAGIEKLSSSDLDGSTVEQRAGLVRVLASGMWMGEAEEQAAMNLIEYQGQGMAVVETLRTIGILEEVLEGIDDEQLSARLLNLSAEPAEMDEPPDADTVLQTTDFSSIDVQQRVESLTTLLDLSTSNAEEESKILDILATDPGGLMRSLRDLGLKQLLFDHIDEANNKKRLTNLLQPLKDPELDADLAVFNNGALTNLVEGVTGGLLSAVEWLDPTKLIMGLLTPVLHPLDSAVGLIDQGLGFLQQPSLDGLLAFIRDLTGTLGVWLLETSAALAGAGVLLGLATVTAPAGLAAEGLAANTLAWSTFMGAIFLVCTGLKAVTDLGQATAATTDHEQKREQQQIGEDATLLVSIGLFGGLLRGLKATLGWIRGPAVDPKLSNLENLKKVEGEVEKGTEEGNQAVSEMEEAGKPAALSDTKQTTPPKEEVEQPLQTREPSQTDPKAHIGKDFEAWLVERHQGRSSFKEGGREFDGAIGNRWYEAKSGRYWQDHTQPGPGFEKFKSDMGSRARIARAKGASYEIHSNSPIPEHVKTWLESRNIQFFEY